MFDVYASYVRYSVSGIGVMLLLSALVVLSCIDQDDARHSFGHTGGENITPFLLCPIYVFCIVLFLS